MTALLPTEAQQTEPVKPVGHRLVSAACLASGGLALTTAGVAWTNGGHAPLWLLIAAFAGIVLAGLAVAADVITGKGSTW